MPIWSPVASKPNLGTRPEPGKPLAAGLQGFYALGENGGLSAYDAAQNLTLTAAGSQAWSAAAMPGLALNLTTSGVGAFVPPNQQYAFPLSAAFAFRFLGLPSSGGTPLFGLYATNTTNSRILVFESNAGATIEMGYPVTAFGVTTPSSLNVDYVVSGMVNNASQLNYINGVLKSTTTTAGITPGWTATSWLTIGSAGTFFSGRTANIIVYWAAWWNRRLTVAEHTAIGASPSAIFPLVFGTPRPYWLIIPKVAVGGLVRRTLFDQTGSRGVA